MPSFLFLFYFCSWKTRWLDQLFIRLYWRLFDCTTYVLLLWLSWLNKSSFFYVQQLFYINMPTKGTHRDHLWVAYCRQKIIEKTQNTRTWKYWLLNYHSQLNKVKVKFNKKFIVICVKQNLLLSYTLLRTCPALHMMPYW